jgi:hypothetical protein
MSKVLAVLKKSSSSLLPETIADRAGMSTGAVLAELNKLEFEDKVSSLGGRYSLFVVKPVKAAASRSRTAKPKPKRKSCHEPTGRVREVRVVLTSYRDDSGRFVCSPKKGTRPTNLAPIKLEPIRAKLKPKTVTKAREKGTVSQPWGDSTVKYKYKLNARGQRVGLTVTSLALGGQLGKDYARAIRGKDKATRQSAVRFKRTLVADAKAQLLEELKITESNADLASSVRSEIGKRSARTRAAKKKAGKVKVGPKVTEARTEVKHLDLVLEKLNTKINRAKSAAVKRTASSRRTKVNGWRAGWAKIAAGKAKNPPKGYRRPVVGK